MTQEQEGFYKKIHCPVNCLIWMVNTAGIWLTILKRHIERVHREFRVDSLADGPADDFPREQVQDYGHEDEPR